LVLARDLGVRYSTKKTKSDDFKAHTHNYLVGLARGKTTAEPEAFWALRQVSFAGYPGDIIGIIGTNGAGKTTLCRAVLGLLQPNEGDVEANGNIASLLSLGAGFNQELSGRENIFINATMLGLNKKKIKELIPAIQDFSGIDQRFSSMPIKHYSNGMKARLGFSVAAAVDAEILLIDEVLSAGDLAFQEKAAKRMHDLVLAARLALVVTHSLSFVEEYCNKALWLEDGQLKAYGEPLEVTAAYKEFSAKFLKNKKKKVLSLCESKTNINKSASTAELEIEETTAVAGHKKTIEVCNLGICFRINKQPFWALKEVSFSIFDNEIVGIIGPNGAGKTTLCRTLCGLYRGDKGSVAVNGSVTALLSFGAGFESQLSGLDNIYLNGMMLGMPKKAISNLEAEIIEFAELEKFIHKPVKYYSSGMRARLGFSIAATLNPDILIIDEALSAGDITFQGKAAGRMQDIIGDAKSVIIVTHSLQTVEKLCNRAIWLDHGTIHFDGKPREAVALYKQYVRKQKNNKVST